MDHRSLSSLIYHFHCSLLRHNGARISYSHAIETHAPVARSSSRSMVVMGLCVMAIATERYRFGVLESSFVEERLRLSLDVVVMVMRVNLRLF